jgi:hypothetical protein
LQPLRTPYHEASSRLFKAKQNTESKHIRARPIRIHDPAVLDVRTVGAIYGVKVVPVLPLTEHHAIKAYWGVEVQLHPFFDLCTGRK